jgi:hypothetical protein
MIFIHSESSTQQLCPVPCSIDDKPRTLALSQGVTRLKHRSSSSHSHESCTHFVSITPNNHARSSPRDALASEPRIALWAEPKATFVNGGSDGSPVKPAGHTCSTK